MVGRTGDRGGGGGEWIVRMVKGREEWDRCGWGGIKGGHIRSRTRLMGMAVRSRLRGLARML
jgi:hypothetical protein